jgi:hypothetical protein
MYLERVPAKTLIGGNIVEKSIDSYFDEFRKTFFVFLVQSYYFLFLLGALMHIFFVVSLLFFRFELPNHCIIGTYESVKSTIGRNLLVG